MTSYPTPWNVEATNALDHDDRTTVPMAQITADDGTPVCQLRGADAAELAGRIVRAVNAQAYKDAELRPLKYEIKRLDEVIDELNKQFA